MLTKDDILFIMERISREVVVPATDNFPFEITQKSRGGYSDDRVVGALQAKLSIMLEVASKADEL